MLSCIQPTGQVHLGNYLGALRNWVSGQHAGDVFHGIVDLHALTVTETPGTLGANTLDLAAMLFAVGLDPNVATVSSNRTCRNIPNWAGSWNAR